MSLTLETRISIAAPIEKVWEALTSPEIVKQYFFGTDLVTSWQPGTPVFFRGEWEGTTYEDKGIVQAFDPPNSLRYNYLSSWSDLPDLPENYANISYTLHRENDITVLTITQDGFEDEEKRNHSEQNWQSVMGGMKDLLEKTND